MSQVCARMVRWGLLALLVCGCRAGWSTVLLKPTGQQAMPLRVKALSAHVVITKQFAVTKSLYTFVNETSSRIEADFMYTLPDGAVATYFAYWFGSEKVIARIVEKERAAEIYQHITSRMRDPALVELIGKNTFRARIFPIMPNSDLKVELWQVQPLASDGSDVEYTFPLLESNVKTAAMTSLEVTIEVAADAAITKVTNNLGVPVTKHDKGYRIAVTGKNYRPQKDLHVRLERQEQPLQAALYAAPSGGADGFFALALTPDQALKSPKVAITGVSTYALVPFARAAVEAHQALLLYGRYKGSGKATVTLTGQGATGALKYHQDVTFGGTAEPNNLATKLWAAGRIEQLGKKPADRKAVIALSTQYTLPSEYTSWLAVPKEEMQRYRQEKLEAQIYATSEQLAQLIAEGRNNSRAARRLRTQLNGMCKEVGYNAHGMLLSQLHDKKYDLAYRYGNYVYDRQEQSPEARRLRARLNTLCRHLGEDVRPTLRDAFDRNMCWAAEEVVSQRRSATPDRKRIAEAKARLEHLARISGASSEDYLRNAEYPWYYRDVEAARKQLVAELAKAAPDATQLAELKAKFIQLNRKIYTEDYAQARTERLVVRSQLEKVLARLKDPTQLTAEETRQLQQQKTQLTAREETLHVRMGDPLIQVEAPADAQVIALLPGGEVKRLAYNADRRRWEARFDVPAYATEGEYVITIIIVRPDGTRQVLTMRYQVDLTPPSGVQQVERLVEPAPAVRLAIDASEDTARVLALLPWDERVNLDRASTPNRFLAIVPLPESYRTRPVPVTFILTDQAHNRTVLTVEVGE